MKEKRKKVSGKRPLHPGAGCLLREPLLPRRRNLSSLVKLALIYSHPFWPRETDRHGRKTEIPFYAPKTRPGRVRTVGRTVDRARITPLPIPSSSFETNMQHVPGVPTVLRSVRCALSELRSRAARVNCRICKLFAGRAISFPRRGIVLSALSGTLLAFPKCS